MGKQISEKRKKGELLSNPNWEKFCQLYARDTEFFGNGVESYLEAYSDGKRNKPLSYMAAKSAAWRLLTKDAILARINELLELNLNNEIVDKNLGIVILQNADYKAKVSAIKEYNQLKQRVKQPNGNQTNIIVLPAEILKRNGINTKSENNS